MKWMSSVVNSPEKQDDDNVLLDIITLVVRIGKNGKNFRECILHSFKPVFCRSKASDVCKVKGLHELGGVSS